MAIGLGDMARRSYGRGDQMVYADSAGQPQGQYQRPMPRQTGYRMSGGNTPQPSFGGGRGGGGVLLLNDVF